MTPSGLGGNGVSHFGSKGSNGVVVDASTLFALSKSQIITPIIIKVVTFDFISLFFYYLMHRNIR